MCIPTSLAPRLGQLLRCWACFAVVASDAWSLQHLNSPVFQNAVNTPMSSTKKLKVPSSHRPVLSYPKKPFLISWETWTSKRKSEGEQLWFRRLESAVTLLVRQNPKKCQRPTKKWCTSLAQGKDLSFFEEFQFGFYSLLLVPGGLDDFEDLPDPSQCPWPNFLDLLRSRSQLLLPSHRVGSLGVSVAPKVSSEGW